MLLSSCRDDGDRSEHSREMFFGNVRHGRRPEDETNLTTRSSTCQPRVLTGVDAVMPAATHPLGEVIAGVRSALDHIDPTFARVYKLHAFEQRSYEQIAIVLKIERVTVGTRLNRARKMLRKVLSRRLGIEEAP